MIPKDKKLKTWLCFNSNQSLTCSYPNFLEINIKIIDIISSAISNDIYQTAQMRRLISTFAVLSIINRFSHVLLFFLCPWHNSNIPIPARKMPWYVLKAICKVYILFSFVRSIKTRETGDTCMVCKEQRHTIQYNTKQYKTLQIFIGN